MLIWHDERMTDASAPAFPEPKALALLVEIGRQQSEHGHASIGMAAHAVGMAQPNASRLLRSFESEYGVYLLQRSPRGSRLTAHGEAVAAWAVDVVNGYDNLLAGLRALRGEATAQLRICASQTIAEYLLPRWLAQFRIMHPAAEVSLQVANSAQVGAQVRAHSADLGFVESPAAPRGVAETVIGTDTLVVVARPGHECAAGPALDAAQLAGLPLLVRESGSGTRDVIDDALAGVGGPAIAAELSSTAALKVSAAAGLAPAAVSRLAVAEELASGRFVALPLSAEVNLERPLRALWPHDRRPRGAAQDFLNLTRHLAG